jgi:hypothetical protein
MAHSVVAGDPFAMRIGAGSSLRLKNGCAQDDAMEEQARYQKKFNCTTAAVLVYRPAN